MTHAFRIQSERIPAVSSVSEMALKDRRALRQRQSEIGQQLAQRILHPPLKSTLTRHHERWTVNDQKLPCIALTHAGPWVLCAMDPQHLCAIDIESTARTMDLRYAIEHFLHPQMREVLAPLPPAVQHNAFFLLWTALEARGKLLELPLNQTVAEPLFNTEIRWSAPPHHPHHRYFSRWFDATHLSTVLCHQNHTPLLMEQQWQPMRTVDDMYEMSAQPTGL